MITDYVEVFRSKQPEVAIDEEPEPKKSPPKIKFDNGKPKFTNTKKLDQSHKPQKVADLPQLQPSIID